MTKRDWRRGCKSVKTGGMARVEWQGQDDEGRDDEGRDDEGRDGEGRDGEGG